MANVVNLDALIPREDLEVDEKAPNLTSIQRISIKDLEEGFLLNALRKPDFQRETADWSTAKILDLIRTFLDGDLVPAVILWQAGASVFVIDGAHRLSALLSWVHNDYGDGTKSQNFFENKLPPEQIKIAQRARKLIHAEIGAYSEYAAAAKNVGTADQKIKDRLGRMGVIAIPVQWVPAVTVKQAEDSFFKINQAATPIDPTELRILKSRASPNARAARAIVRSGTGHKYWKDFSDHVQTEIQNLGKSIHAALYEPPLNEPITTLDIPVAGRGYQTLPFVFDLVNLANGVNIPDSTNRRILKDILSKDDNGSKTIEFLKRTRWRVQLITGKESLTIGPHPAVYFYTRGGKFQASTFLATSALLDDLEKTGKLKTFTEVRRDFEEFLVRHRDFVTQIVHKLGSGERSIARIKALYMRAMECLWEGKDDAAIVAALKANNDFKFLVEDAGFEEPSPDKRKFSRGIKTAAFLTAALETAVRCHICHARLHINSIQIDHDTAIKDGGGASLENAKPSHPYCNSIKG